MIWMCFDANARLMGWRFQPWTMTEASVFQMDAQYILAQTC